MDYIKLNPEPYDILKENVDKVVVYEIDCSKVEFQPRHIFTTRTGKSKVLSFEEYLELHKILDSPETYKSSTAACFEPEMVIIFYKPNNVPFGYIALCLLCNFDMSNIVLERNKTGGLMGYSSQARNEMRTIFNKWTMSHDHVFSLGFDDPEIYDALLEKSEAPDKK